MDPADIPPPAQSLPLLDDADYCDGAFCKLPGRIIPEGLQVHEISIQGHIVKVCMHCLRALGNPVNGHSALFGNNTMYRNGFHP